MYLLVHHMAILTVSSELCGTGGGAFRAGCWAFFARLGGGGREGGLWSDGVLAEKVSLLQISVGVRLACLLLTACSISSCGSHVDLSCQTENILRAEWACPPNFFPLCFGILHHCC